MSADICDETYFETPKDLLNDIETYPEKYGFLMQQTPSIDIVSYYKDCFKLDSVPYINNSELISGIDDDELMKDGSYKLSDEQYKEMCQKLFYKKKKGKGECKITKELALNVLCINMKKGRYVLCYRELKLDIKNRCLCPGDEIITNKSFAIDENTNEVTSVFNYTMFLPEEDSCLFDDVAKNIEEIKNAIHDYYHTANSSYNREVKIDDRPFIFTQSKNHLLDIDSQLDGINQMESENSMPAPLKIFLGTDVNHKRGKSSAIFCVDDKFNIDQINAIDKAMKYAVSYIQGPPGTGKTKTLLNAIITAEFAGKTVLVSSNNNVPMDGLYNDFLRLNYKSNIPLLFPIIRLGNFECVDKAIDRINNMRKEAESFVVNETKLGNIRKDRMKAMEGLSKILSDNDKLNDLKTRKETIEKILESDKGSGISLALQTHLALIEEEIKKAGSNVSEEEFRNKMIIDTRNLFMSIHFDTVNKIKKLKHHDYDGLRTILDMSVRNDDERKNRVKEFKLYLKEDETLHRFQEIFPVIITTNLSCAGLGNPTPHFDIVMMDEAGQCSITNALIAIIRGERLLLVGDPQQLKPVILLDNKINERLKRKYCIGEAYDYIKNSVYTAFTDVDVTMTETLLSYHYRCNSKIIGFSNKKYYNGKLHTCAANHEENPLIFIDTSEADRKVKENEKNTSLSEIKAIEEYIKNNPNESIGIITPFVKQKELIENYIADKHISNVSIGTVHAFQGDEKGTILFSTGITKNTRSSTYNWLKNNRELINVAVSRAKNKLVMLGSKSAIENLNKSNQDGQDDFSELKNYMETNGKCEVTNVAIQSFALGTKEQDSESEKEFLATINHVLSVLDVSCVTKTQVPIKSILKIHDKGDFEFINGDFDLVIFTGSSKYRQAIVAFEVNGPEHEYREGTKARDVAKQRICDKNGFQLIFVRRDLVRDYGNVKKVLSDILQNCR